MTRTRKPARQADNPPEPPVYILAYKTNNPAVFNLPSPNAIISAHESKSAATEAGRTWIASMLEEQKQLELEERSRRVRFEDEDGWHTGEWEELDGSWKSMINAKGGYRDLVVSFRRYEASYESEGKGNTRGG